MTHHQKELYQINEKQTIDIEISADKDGFLIQYDNGRVKDAKFSIRLDAALLLSLYTEFEKKTKEFFLEEELQINDVKFDFYRGNSLYFDIYFENNINQDAYQARMYVYYMSNNHGNIGEIHSFHLVNNRMA